MGKHQNMTWRATRDKSGNKLWASTCGSWQVRECRVCQGVQLVPVKFRVYRHRSFLDYDGTVYWSWLEVSRHRTEKVAKAHAAKLDRKLSRSP